MRVLESFRRLGVAGSARKALALIQRKSGWTTWAWRYRHFPVYASPTPKELEIIERDLIALGVTIQDYAPPRVELYKFMAENWFPPDYHGGMGSGVWHEKILEHWISSERLKLMKYSPSDIYIDVAAASSPWAQALRERKGISAYAIDLKVPETYRHLSYYREENATQTTFEDTSVKGVSLHCAYEMFMGEDDMRLIHEVARILQPGGKVVILPLYLHTHYCAYSTPDYFGKGYSDSSAMEYIRIDSTGIPSSRKYDAVMLKQRILDRIDDLGMHYQLLALRNKVELGENIYCHFILEIMR